MERWKLLIGPTKKERNAEQWFGTCKSDDSTMSCMSTFTAVTSHPAEGAQTFLPQKGHFGVVPHLSHYLRACTLETQQVFKKTEAIVINIKPFRVWKVSVGSQNVVQLLYLSKSRHKNKHRSTDVTELSGRINKSQDFLKALINITMDLIRVWWKNGCETNLPQQCPY